MMNHGLYSSKTMYWETPRWIFDSLCAVYPFDVDVCATPNNAKCPRYFTETDDAMAQTWRGVCWMNPPYGREIGTWVNKARRESQFGATVVCLLPARTDTRWWHNDVLRAEQVLFVRGRLKFRNAAGNDAQSAPFPSAIVVFSPRSGLPRFGTISETQGITMFFG